MSETNVIVLKLGISVLRSPASLPEVVAEIRRHATGDTRVLAIVSAFLGATDTLFAEARAAIGVGADRAVAHYVATGEMQSVALLTGALTNAGVNASVLDPREVELHVQGEPLNAEPVEVDVRSIQQAFERNPVLVMPGFFGIDADRQLALLGRGGSDYSALFIARQLRARCRLVKDVPGIFDRDPATAAAAARRFVRIGWQHALEVAGKLVQPKALVFAHTHRVSFSVGALASAEHTAVGDYESLFALTESAA
jgi:homoserine dehydrogenase